MRAPWQSQLLGKLVLDPARVRLVASDLLPGIEPGNPLRLRSLLKPPRHELETRRGGTLDERELEDAPKLPAGRVRPQDADDLEVNIRATRGRPAAPAPRRTSRREGTHCRDPEGPSPRLCLGAPRSVPLHDDAPEARAACSARVVVKGGAIPPVSSVNSSMSRAVIVRDRRAASQTSALA